MDKYFITSFKTEIANAILNMQDKLNPDKDAYISKDELPKVLDFFGVDDVSKLLKTSPEQSIFENTSEAEQQDNVDALEISGQEDNQDGVENPTQEDNQDTAENSNQEEDDDLDTSVDPNARITILPSIAINNTTNEITNAMEQAVSRAGAELLGKSSDDSYLKAQNMVQDNRSYKCFDEINYTKKFNIYGKAVYEGNYQKYSMNGADSEIKMSQNSEKVDLGLNWKSKSDNTKIFAFGSYTHTDQNLLINNNIDSGDTSEDIDSNNKANSYSMFGAVQHRLKNGDLLTGGGFHINDAILDTQTTSFDASYYYRKFMVLAEGKTTIYKVSNSNSVTKTDFSISLNPELAKEPSQKEKASPENETETNQEVKKAFKPDKKKWSTAFSPFFDTQTIAGDTEEGLGVKLRFKRTDKNSTLRFTTFGKVSTTQQEENNKYHVTLGSGVKYNKNIGAHSNLIAKADIKDKVTFGHENILTASAHAIYTSPKFSAEAEAKRILISGDQPSYAAIVGRAYYTPTNNVNLYAEASYVNHKEQDYNLEGTNIQAGVIVNF